MPLARKQTSKQRENREQSSRRIKETTQRIRGWWLCNACQRGKDPQSYQDLRKITTTGAKIFLVNSFEEDMKLISLEKMNIRH